MKNLSIRTKIIVATVSAAAASMGVLTLSNLSTMQATAQASAKSSAEILSEAYAERLGDWVEDRIQALRSMAPLVDAAEPHAGLLAAKVSGGFDTTYIGWADKHYAFSTPQNIPSDWDPTARPWYTQAASESKVTLTSPYIDAATKKLVVTFAAPVQSGTTLKAVTAGDVFIDGVVATVVGIKPSPNSFAYLVDDRGVVIAQGRSS